jgi:hypothetical protein
MTYANKNLTIAILFILTGIALLLHELNLLTEWLSWPLILITIGILLLIKFLRNPESYQILMPVAILLIIGTLFLYLERASYHHIGHLWPTFILAPGVGFLFLFLFGPPNNSYWVPALILSAVAGLFYLNCWHFGRFWPFLFVLIGVTLLLQGLLAKRTASK